MSFAAIRSIATSALNASQVRIQVASSNIANADVEGYSRQTAVQAATAYEGVGTGTTITAITSDVDRYLLRDLVGEASELGAAEVTAAKADALQSLFGTTTSSDDTGTSIAASIALLDSALSALAGTPESSTLDNVAVESLDTVAAELRELSTGIQELRETVDAEIGDAVDVVNTALTAIGELNTRIVAAKSSGQPTADLEDQRNAALMTVSEQLAVTYVVKSSGEMLVSTASGTTLVNSSVHLLSYSPAATVTADTVFDGITVDGVDITAQIAGGRLGALVEQRDTELPAAQDALDELATSLITAINTAAGEEVVTGTDAATIRVRDDIREGTTKLAGGSASMAQALADALADADLTSTASVIVSDAATAASAATSALERQQSAYDAASDALTSITGVNVDEETARLSEFEQLYSAAAQLLQVLNDMFDALLSAARA
jgi:flagellar hook-associated protein 1 FlgK